MQRRTAKVVGLELSSASYECLDRLHVVSTHGVVQTSQLLASSLAGLPRSHGASARKAWYPRYPWSKFEAESEVWGADRAGIVLKVMNFLTP